MKTAEKSRLTGWMTARSRMLVCLAFVLAAVLGLFLVDDCGIGVDEKTERQILDVNMKAYVQLLAGDDSALARSLGDIPDIDTYVERDHGQAQSYLVWPLMHMARQQGNFAALENIYHMGLHLLFLLGLFGLYSIVRRLTGSRGAGLVSAALLYVNPRFFAESFYNNKDVALLSLCLIVFWLGLRFVQENTWNSCVLFGIAGAVAANTRAIGLAAFGVCGLVYLADVTVRRAWSRRAFLRGVAAVAAWLLAFYLLTPACWHDFFGFWQYYLGATANFDAARWNGWFLYRGAVYNPVENPIPWHYIPWLMMITTPLLILALAAGFVVLAAVRCGRHGGRWGSTPMLFCGGLGLFCLLPILYSMLAHPNLYNGWRHMYFTYGTVVIFAGLCLHGLWQCRKKWLRCAMAAVLCLHFAFFAGFIAANRPNEFAYFNVLAGPHPEQRYDADYWNIAEYTIIDEMLARDPEFSAVCRGGTGINWNWYRIKDTMPQRFTERNEEVSWERRNRAKYILDNTSAWQTELLHPTVDMNDPAVQNWFAVTDTLEPVFQVKCGRTVLWNVYENPEYNLG